MPGSTVLMKLTSVAVVVSDREKSQAWYTKTLGFRVVDDDRDHWVTVAPEGANVALHLCAGEGLEPGNTGIGFSSKDVAATAKELQAKGVKFSQLPEVKPWGTIAKFLDPDGNEFWLSSE
jgi:lactoylglutathione lyase